MWRMTLPCCTLRPLLCFKLWRLLFALRHQQAGEQNINLQSFFILKKEEESRDTYECESSQYFGANFSFEGMLLSTKTTSFWRRGGLHANAIIDDIPILNLRKTENMVGVGQSSTNDVIRRWLWSYRSLVQVSCLFRYLIADWRQRCVSVSGGQRQRRWRRNVRRWRQQQQRQQRRCRNWQWRPSRPRHRGLPQHQEHYVEQLRLSDRRYQRALPERRRKEEE